MLLVLLLPIGDNVYPMLIQIAAYFQEAVCIQLG